MHLCLGCIDDLWVVGCCALVCAAGALLLRSVGGLYQLQTGGRAHGESDEYLLNYWDPYIPNSWMLYTGKSIYINGWFGGTRILSYSRYSRKPPYIAIWYIYTHTHTHLYIKLQMATDTVTTCFDAFSCCIFHRAWHMISFSLPFSSQHQDFHHPLRRWFASTASLWLHWYQCRWFAWFRHSLRDLESQAWSRMEYNKKKN